MVQQTAVGWLYEKLSTCTSGEMVGNINSWFEQAKVMERDQMKQAVMRSVTTWHPLRKLFEKQFEEYYNETYKTK